MHRFEDRMTVIWTAVVYGTTAISLWSYSLGDDPRPGGWRLVGLAALLVAFFLLYHRVYLPAGDHPPLRVVLGYGLTEAAIVTLILTIYSREFIGMGIALACQLIAVLPARYWLVPIAGVLALFAGVFNFAALLRDGDLEIAVMIGLQALIYLVAFGTVVIALRQRWRLAALVEELRLAQAELRQAAAQADELAMLRERNRLAREMHDSLGHSLVTVNVRLEVVERLYARDPARGEAELRATRDLVRQAVVELRHSLDDLRGPLPPARDIAVELRRLLADVRERSTLAVSSDVASTLPDLPPLVVAALRAVLREALQNVERHAAAGSVHVTLAATAETLTLQIADDGGGVEPAVLAKPGRHGITGMRERMSALGGTLAVEPRPGGGTSVTATVPMTPDQSSRNALVSPAGQAAVLDRPGAPALVQAGES